MSNMKERCDKLEDFGFTCLFYDVKVVHKGLPDTEMDFSNIDLETDLANINITNHLISYVKGE